MGRLATRILYMPTLSVHTANRHATPVSLFPPAGTCVLCSVNDLGDLGVLALGAVLVAAEPLAWWRRLPASEAAD